MDRSGAPNSEEDITVACRWQSRALDISLPLGTVRTLWKRALQWDISEGGRYEIRTCRTLMIWPGRIDHDHGGKPEPIGSITVRWNMPTDNQVMMTRIAWHPRHGSETLVWQALEVLAGRTPVVSG